MFNRTLNRPMFRRGGRASGGIMTGVETPRQGYDGSDGKQNVVQNDFEKVTTQRDLIEKLSPRYNNQGSDFFMGLGANILAAPGGQPIFQTLGTAAKEPLGLLMKQNIAEYGNRRDNVMQVFKQLSDGDKDAMINRAEAMVKADPERFPGGVKDALAILIPTYRKDQSPEESEREKILSEQGNTDDAIKKIGTQYELGTPDATTLNTFFENIQSGEYEGAPHDPGTFFIDDDDVARSGKDSRLVIQGYDPKQQQDYKDGRVYIDFINKIAYVKQGQFFVPYSEWSAEEISTD